MQSVRWVRFSVLYSQYCALALYTLRQLRSEPGPTESRGVGVRICVKSEQGWGHGQTSRKPDAVEVRWSRWGSVVATSMRQKLKEAAIISTVLRRGTAETITTTLCVTELGVTSDD